jgi:hypothetical protein
MKNLIYLSLFAILLSACRQPQPAETSEEADLNLNMELRAELMEILAQDQDLRISLDTMENMYDWDSEIVRHTWQQIHYNDSVNLIRIEKIIEDHGWPGKTLVGEDAADIAFLVLQHCGDVVIMEKYLPIIEQAVGEGELDKPSLALFVDRIRMFKGEDQLYGTQLSYNDSTKILQLYPVEDEQNLNARRAQMGLIPIEDYLQHFDMEYQKPE